MLGADIPPPGRSRVVKSLSSTDLTWQLFNSRSLTLGGARVSRQREKLVFDQQWFHWLVDTSPAGLFHVDAEGYCTYTNASWQTTFGLSFEDSLGYGWLRNIHPQDRRNAYVRWQQAVSAGRDFNVQFRLIKPNGDIRYIETNSVAMITENANPAGFVGSIQDITERKQTEQNLKDSEEKYRTLVQSSPFCIHQIDDSGCIASMNKAGLNMMGLKKEADIIGMSYLDAVCERDRAHIEQLLIQAQAGQEAHYDFEATNGRHFQSCFIPVHGSDQIHMMGITQDITEKKVSEELIWHQANFDSLTNLPNRDMFSDRMEQEIKKGKRYQTSFALLFIDLDHFKGVNDTLGHNMGDILLVEAARRIGACLRESDTVARFGGDEFTVILPSLEQASSVERIAQSIIDTLAQPFQLEHESVFVSASIGVTLYPDDATEVEDLYKFADQAMYVAKNKGRNRYSLFTKSLQESAENKRSITNALREALSKNQLEVYYQPIVELDTGNIQKAEALIRWKHPQHGIVSPAEFIPLAEESGLIVDIGEWIFKQAANQVKRFRDQFHPQFQISVNKSPVQFFDEQYQASCLWEQYLLELGLPGDSIAVEITEGLLLDSSSHVNERLLAFRDAGIQVSVDDFGTGYSSLSYLKKFDVDYIKIDQSFICNLGVSDDDLALCEAIIVMAHKLGMKVIAEGVETSYQREVLVTAGCDYIQGYLVCKPMPLESFFRFLRSYNFQEII
jgi:diguanylate cyclase (GGDEF)-like protein/PAS domain S-box-containing protein